MLINCTILLSLLKYFLCFVTEFTVQDEFESRPHNCKFCGKVFTRAKYLHMHQKTSCHLNPQSKNYYTQTLKPFSCSVCGLSYTTRIQLNFHVKHECGKIQKCSICGNTFLHYSSLYKHQLRCH